MTRPRPFRLLLVAGATTLGTGVLLPETASGHADADVIAVAAGEEVTIKFRPDHGCEGSPTIEVAVRAPVPGVTAIEVAGWTASANADGQDRTVLEWTGGSLPADQTGEFPVTFTAPDQVGELLLFPAVQTCVNGEELSWVSGDPESDNPAPRLLILAPGTEEAVTIDEVPADAPGREKLSAVIQVEAPTTTAPATTTTQSPGASTTTAAEAPTVTTTAPDNENTTGNDPSSLLAFAVAVAAVVIAAGIGGFLLWRRRR